MRARILVVAACSVLVAGVARAQVDPRPRDPADAPRLHTVRGPVSPSAAAPTSRSAPPRRPERLGGLHNRPVAGRRPYLLQLDRAVDPGAAAKVQAAGAKIRGYFPDDALLVSASPDAALALQRLPGVRALLEQPPTWRIDPKLAAATGEAPVEVLVEVAPDGLAKQVADAIVAVGGRLLDGRSSRVLGARIPAGAVEALAARADVAFVAPRPVFTPENDEARGIVLPQLADAPPVPRSWRGLLGHGQVVAVADSGVDLSTCFFEGEGKILGYDVLSGAEDGDTDGHGTHVAGTIAADREADLEVDEYDGIAPAAALYVQDVGNGEDRALVGIPADLAELLGPAYEAGARIHSNSWGSDTPRYGPSARSLDAFVAEHPDLLVVVAAGNDGPDEGSIGSPATAKNVLAVGASGTGDGLDDLASFSSRGPTFDGRLRPSVVAPGRRIWSAAAGAECSVAAKSGTSMATPVVAGAAALLRQYFVEGFHPTGAARVEHAANPSAALLKATLMAGARDLSGAGAESGVPGIGEGFGRVDLEGILWLEGDGRGPRLWAVDDAHGVGAGEKIDHTLMVGERGTVRVVLTWTDPPATSGAERVLVDDLDLVVTGPDGRRFRGNVLSGGRSVTGGEADRANVEEVVILPSAEPGRYTLTVEAANVPSGRRPFALAALAPLDPAYPTPPLQPNGSVRPGIDTAPALKPASADEGCASAGGGASGAFALLAGLGLAWTARRRRAGRR